MKKEKKKSTSTKHILIYIYMQVFHPKDKQMLTLKCAKHINHIKSHLNLKYRFVEAPLGFK